MIHKPENYKVFFKKVSLYILIAVMLAAAFYGGSVYMRNVKSYKASLEEQLALQEQEKIAQAAQQKRQEQIQFLSELALDLKKGNYQSLISFFSQENETYAGSLWCIQNSMLVEETALQEGVSTILLDFDNGSFYVGEVDFQGLRSGQGIQFGYEEMYTWTNANLTRVSSPAVFVYKGAFGDNVAQGKGSYTRILDVSTPEQSAVSFSGSFEKHQMNGSFLVSWAQEGKSYSDEIEIKQGSFAPLFSLGSNLVYARDWNGLLPVSLTFYGTTLKEDTCLWNRYLNHYSNGMNFESNEQI